MADTPDPRPTVLIIEDEALIAMMVEDALAEAGYRVVRAPDGCPAPPAACPAAIPHAAVVGQRLADGADGREVLRRLRLQRPGLPVIVITGFEPGAPEADLRGLGGPIVRLGKPFDCDELVRRLADVLDGSNTPATRCRRASRRFAVGRGAGAALTAR